MAVEDNKHGQYITSEPQLRKLISPYPKMLDKRICPELDLYCLELIERSSLMIAAYGHSRCFMDVLSKNDVVIVDSTTITLSPSNGVGPQYDGVYASVYFLVPGIGHGLRVNGQIQHYEQTLVFKVKSAYLHCARAAARAELWTGSSSQKQADITPFMTPEKFLDVSPYLLMKTMNEVGETELSPRGDKGRAVYSVDQSSLFIPERPGNKVAISLRNILKNDQVELLMFIPGTDFIMHVHGHATLTRKEQILDLAVVNNKRPKLGILLDHCRFSIEQSNAIQQSQPWLSESHVSSDCLTRFSKALSIHMNGEGFIGKAATPFIDAVVKNDMKNLY